MKSKNPLFNAYETRPVLAAAKLSHLMDAETWMNANMAVELGFADEVMKRNEAENDIPQPAVAATYSRVAATNSLMEKLAAKCHIDSKKVEPEPTGRSVDELMEHLNTIKKYI